MSAAPKFSSTVADYLAFERQSPVKHEYYQGRIVAMAGANPVHNTIRENCSGEIYVRVKGSTCRSWSSDQRVKIHDTTHYTYPDIIVQCGKTAFDPDDPMTIVNPTVLIEVLSPSTERHDRIVKMMSYRTIPSLREIVLISQSRVFVERFTRLETNEWTWHATNDIASELALTSIGISIPLADLYRGVTFDVTEDESPAA